MWYVIQVINGREDVMRERIEHVVPSGAMQELFYPQFQTEIKVHGEWVNTTKPLFPGYLICDTTDPRTVQQYLLRMDDFARVLSQDGQFVPLAKEEVQLIGGFTHRGDRVVPMSEAIKDGDQVVVTAGPLLGHEGLIKTINIVLVREKRQAPAGGGGGQAAPVELPENPLALLFRIHRTPSWTQIGSEILSEVPNILFSLFTR